MGTFRVDATVSSLHDRSRRKEISLIVDTGATYTTLPTEVMQAIGCEPIDTRRVQFANGRVEEWPVGIVYLELDGREGPTFCLSAPRGGPALLGAVTLEEFALGVDPTGRRLVPVTGYLMTATR